MTVFDKIRPSPADGSVHHLSLIHIFPGCGLLLSHAPDNLVDVFVIRLCRHFQFLFSGLRLHGLELGRRDFCFCCLCRLRNFRLCGNCLLSRLLPAAVPEGFRCGGDLPAGGLGCRCIRREEPPCRLGQEMCIRDSHLSATWGVMMRTSIPLWAALMSEETISLSRIR